MDVRAAVAHKAGQPLAIETVQLAGPKAGEVLVEIKATGICHTDEFTRSGADPEGLFPAILGHEGAGIVVDVGPGVTSVKRRSRHSAVHARMPAVQVVPVAQDQSVHGDPRHARQRRDARWHEPFLAGGQPVHHYMGCSTFANFTVLPEIAVAKIREDAPFDKVCYIGCGVTTGIGAVINTAKVEAGANVVVFGLGGIGLNVVQGARMVGANMIIGVDLNPAREALARKFGMTHFVNPKDVEGDLVPHLVELTGGGADYTFECIGNVDVMRQALECCHRGWGVVGDHRRGRLGAGDPHAPTGSTAPRRSSSRGRSRPGATGSRSRWRAPSATGRRTGAGWRAARARTPRPRTRRR